MVRADLYFTEAIVINPKYTKALHKRALTRFELKKYDTAMEDIKIAFNLQKANSEIHAAYSKIL
jgi:Tfp pilus assembly protein PilF